MAWEARLALDYSLEAGRVVARFEHSGPLRILQSLYPEGDATCHNVLVHPPGGLVGGDVLRIDVKGREGTHGLVTTPGAGRFYRSDGPEALQHTQLRLEPGARFEWLPLETIYFSGCRAVNRLQLDLSAGAECLGWDVAALGLPASGQPFDKGSVRQEIALGDDWLEKGRIEAQDTRLMDGPLGLAGRRCLATLFFATGSDLARARREQALEAAREVLQAHELAAFAGATSPHPRVLGVRVIAPLVEPAMGLLRAVRRAWRPLLWQLPPHEPRGWAI
jgi:urease accessory protein